VTSDTLSRIDAATGDVVSTISLGSSPVSIAARDGAVWVTSQDTGELLRVDPGDDRLSRAIAIGQSPDGLAVGAGSVWVADAGGTVSRFDPRTGKVRTIKVSGAPVGVAFADGAVWVASTVSGTVSKIDPQTGAAQVIQVGNEPTDIAAAGNDVWATVLPSLASHRGGTLTVINQLPPDEGSQPPTDPAIVYYTWAWQMLSLTNDGLAAAFNPATGTLYVASPKGDVFVIDAASCNAVTTRGCTQSARKVKVIQGPQALDVDFATDTVYTADAGSGNGDTVSVIDGATCNGTDGSGCGRAPRTITVGSGAWWVAVDQASGTVYVADNNDGTVSVINGALCNAAITSGCGSIPPTVTTGADPQFVAVDPSSGTAFVMNLGDNTLSGINTSRCNGTVMAGCRNRAQSEQASPDTDPGYNPFPNAFALVAQTGSA